VSSLTNNAGSVAAGPFRIGVYLSTNTFIGQFDRLVGTCTRTVSLAAGASAGCGGTVTIPDDLAPGTYYLGVIADIDTPEAYLAALRAHEASVEAAANQSGATSSRSDLER